MRRVAIVTGGAAIVLLLAMTCMPRGTHADALAQQPAETSGAASHAGNGVIGEWWTEGRIGRVRFERHTDGTYRGIASWRAPNVNEKESPSRDLHNKNPKLRGRSTLGIILISNLEFEGGKYTHGRVYNPRDGDSYGFKMELLDKNTLKIRAYYGISIFGQTQVWKRYFPTDSPPKS